MCAFIGIETLAANALIELLNKSDKREVTFDTLVRYGMAIVRFYQQETGDEAVLLLSRKYQTNMVDNYSNLFDVKMDETGEGTFTLKEGVSVEDLECYFRWNLSMKLLNAFVAPEALQTLGVSP